MLNSYWNSNGRYQDFVSTIQKLCDKLINGKVQEQARKCSLDADTEAILVCYRGMVTIYNDVYNNGKGCNIAIMKDILENKVRPVMGVRFGSINRFYADAKYLEYCMNKVILKVYMSKIRMTRTFNLITYKGKFYITPSIKELEPCQVVLYKTVVGVCTYKDIEKYAKSKKATFLDKTLKYIPGRTIN
jgi:hypothetical protein